MRNTSGPSSRWATAAAAGLAAVLLLTACSADPAKGTGGSTDTAHVDEAQAILDQLIKPLQFHAPGPAFDVGTKAQGKTLYFISAALGYEFTQNVLKGMQAAADKAGMSIVALDAKGDTSTASRQIQQAISQDAAAIAIMSFSAESLAAPLREAKAAGIPVVDVFDGDPGLPSAEQADIGVVGKASYCYTCFGQQLAAMAVAQGKGDVHAALVGVPDTPAAVLEADGFKSELKRLCGSCTVKEYGSSTAQWGTEVPSIGTAIGQNPNINFVVPVFAILGDLMKPSLLAAGAEKRISIVTVNASKTTMADLRNKELITGIVGSPEIWMGWATMDQVLRVLTGQPAVQDSKVENRAFTSANVEDANPDTGANYGDVDFASEYLKLWGLG
jgi:ribose transport system substrate-binding protein